MLPGGKLAKPNGEIVGTLPQNATTSNLSATNLIGINLAPSISATKTSTAPRRIPEHKVFKDGRVITVVRVRNLF